MSSNKSDSLSTLCFQTSEILAL